MALTATWYMTDVTRLNGNDPWNVQGTSQPINVWFGEQTEWDALTTTEKAAYNLYIIDEPGGARVVEAAEMRAAVARLDNSYTFANNQGYLGTNDIDHDNLASTPLEPSVGVAVDGSAIESSKHALIFTMEPVTNPNLPDGYKGGVGHFDPFRPRDMHPPCLTRGTMVLTEFGEKPVEALVAGDRLVTADHGLRPASLVMSVRLSAAELAARPQLRPIRIRAGALGSNMPAQDLLVSPQHRMLVRSKIAQRMFGAAEILVAARQLLAIDGIDVDDRLDEVEYFHILFQDHEVIFANGAASESLFTGAEGLKAVGQAARDEIFALFPQLAETVGLPVPARLLVAGRQGRQLAARHASNRQLLVS